MDWLIKMRSGGRNKIQIDRRAVISGAADGVAPWIIMMKTFVLLDPYINSYNMLNAAIHITDFAMLWPHFEDCVDLEYSAEARNIIGVSIAQQAKKSAFEITRLISNYNIVYEYTMYDTFCERNSEHEIKIALMVMNQSHRSTHQVRKYIHNLQITLSAF